VNTAREEGRRLISFTHFLIRPRPERRVREPAQPIRDVRAVGIRPSPLNRGRAVADEILQMLHPARPDVEQREQQQTHRAPP